MTPVSINSTAGSGVALADPAGPAAPTDSINESGAAADAPSGDPLARFSAQYGLHPQVQQLAYTSPGGSGGAKSHGASAAKSAGACKAAPAPAAVYDVAKTSQADIDALKKSCDPIQRRLGHTIENAKASYGDLLAKGARILVTTSAGNGGQPVMTLMGPGFDATKFARIHTHYHGDNATVADPEGSKAGTNSRIRAIVARDPQTVFVLPEAANSTAKVDSPRNNNHYKADWSQVRSQAQTTDDALKTAGITKIEKQTLSVHSRGGEVIQNLMALDRTGNLIRADRLELHDSLYGSQGAVAQWGGTANGKAVEKVIYFHGTNPSGRQAVIAKAFPGVFVMVEMSRQKPLDDKTNPVYHDSNGATYTRGNAWTDRHGGKHVPPVVRQFHPDPHYRTTGQFLGMWPSP